MRTGHVRCIQYTITSGYCQLLFLKSGLNRIFIWHVVSLDHSQESQYLAVKKVRMNIDRVSLMHCRLLPGLSLLVIMKIPTLYGSLVSRQDLFSLYALSRFLIASGRPVSSL